MKFENLLLARFGSEGVKEPTHCLLRVGDIDPDVVVNVQLYNKEFGKSPPTSFANYP